MSAFKPEILAPAGSFEMVEAAVRSGADAVYLGTKNFNARRNASNFGGAELEETVKYCHARGVRVHVTLNTLVKNSELAALYKEIESVASCGVDAVIVQDLAVAAIIRECCPSLAMHASTQMAIHNAAGAEMAKELGFSRAVLARELSLKEIAEISARTDIELEAFVHGALCMSVSGQCYLSSMLGGRSGNRGLCAQPCRLDFKTRERDFALSLKDLSAVRIIPELCRAGVSSLKIEGRMKRPEYVAAAVSACRSVINGEEPDMEALRSVFSRSGFTDGYLTGRRDVSMFGVRTKEDVAAAASVLGKIAAAYRNELQTVPVSMVAEFHRGAPSRLTVSDGSNTVSAEGETPQEARTRGMEEADAVKSLAKTGGSPFYADEIKVELDEGLFLPAAAINALRRSALDTLIKLRSAVKPHEIRSDFAFPQPENAGTEKKLYLRFESASQLFDEADKAERVILPLSEIDDAVISCFGDKLVCELPRFISVFDENSINEKLFRLKNGGLKRAAASTLGDIAIIRRAGLLCFGSFFLNVLNSVSAREYAALGIDEMTLSFESSMGDMFGLSGAKTGLAAYGYLPLMLFRACPMKTQKGCGACDGRSRLKDRYGKEFTVLCSGKKYSQLLNSVPLYIGDKPGVKGDFLTLYFTLENKKRCRDVYNIFASGQEFDGERTSGLYYRELL